jgi:predicted RNase H-like HicB family nuclease
MNSMAERIVCRAEFFKENGVYVGLAPELNVSSFGETLDEVRRSLQDAVEAFAEACQAMGTFEEVMEESGYSKRGDSWLAGKLVASRLPVAQGGAQLNEPRQTDSRVP